MKRKSSVTAKSRTACPGKPKTTFFADIGEVFFDGLFFRRGLEAQHGDFTVGSFDCEVGFEGVGAHHFAVDS